MCPQDYEYTPFHKKIMNTPRDILLGIFDGISSSPIKVLVQSQHCFSQLIFLENSDILEKLT